LFEEIKAKAEKGDAQSQFELGTLFTFGKLGVARDEVEAVKWYRKAAEQNTGEAQYNLGLCYHNGDGVARDYAEAVKWLRDVARQTRRVGSVCTGALLLAEAGLLDGRKATTHWKYCDVLARRYPNIDVNPDPIFVRDGNVYTSAGVTAGMDLSLALVEEDHGAQLALEVARDFVLYLRRPGGQSQFSAALLMQATDRHLFRELTAWALDNLTADLSVGALADRVSMSPRNFARVFAAEMRISPAMFVERLRVDVARRRLEESRHSLKRIAAESGFNTVATLRSAFRRQLGAPPGQYRQRFRRG